MLVGRRYVNVSKLVAGNFVYLKNFENQIRNIVLLKQADFAATIKFDFNFTNFKLEKTMKRSISPKNSNNLPKMLNIIK